MTSLLGVGVTFAVAYILVVTANHVSMVLFLLCYEHIEQRYICTVCSCAENTYIPLKGNIGPCSLGGGVTNKTRWKYQRKRKIVER